MATTPSRSSALLHATPRTVSARSRSLVHSVRRRELGAGHGELRVPREPTRPAALAAPRAQHQRSAPAYSVSTRPPALFATVSQRALLENLYSDPEHSQHDIISSGDVVPPFCVQFCPSEAKHQLLAAGDEDGTITVIDSEKSRQVQPAYSRARWRAHHNAIFSIEWVRGRDAMLTGSGDQSCRLWDMNTQDELLRFRGHTGSVKTVSCSPEEPAVFRCSSHVPSPCRLARARQKRASAFPVPT
eukprot:2168752-Prymnesium_polylepis.1